MKPCPALANQPAGLVYRVRLAALFCLALLCLPVCAAFAAGAQPAAARGLPAVVVWDFDNQTALATQPAERIDFLKRALSENLTVALLQVAGLPVVERQRLKDLLAEQKVSAGELADEDSRVRLGKIVGASRMVFGGFFVLGDEVQVHVRVIDTATSRVLFSDETTAPMAGVMQQVEPLNRRLAQALGGAAGAGRSYPAALWQAYDRALGLADAGQLDTAVQALQSLLATDKDFTPAERQLIALLEKMARR
jgi:curli biogenesis system outer membrane secretion channel CsgG